MPCGECDRLRVQVRELKEEIAEWERTGGEIVDTSVNDLAKKIGTHLQPAKMLLALARARGKTVTNERMCDVIGYEGYGTVNILAQITLRARRAGFPVVRIRGVGLSLSPEHCDRILEMAS